MSNLEPTALPRYVALLLGFLLSGCASFEPSLHSQDLMRARQPTVREVQQALDISVEEFVTAEKSLQAFDADIAPYGVLALLVRVENNGTETYKVQQNHIKAFLGDQALTPLSAKAAASQAATSEYAGKALAWTAATGPFAGLFWPATIVGSASHTASVNRRIEQHFENVAFTDALVKLNQVAVGCVYFKLPDEVTRLEKLIVEVVAVKEPEGDKLTSKLSLPTLDLSSPVSTP